MVQTRNQWRQWRDEGFDEREDDHDDGPCEDCENDSGPSGPRYRGSDNCKRHRERDDSPYTERVVAYRRRKART